tara:strand:- start:365 stop:916 length:552 start_codon:yes stop_codon:yes gene_type:complete
MTIEPITHIIDYLDKDYNPTTEDNAHFVSEIFFDENGNIKEKTISYVISGEKESTEDVALSGDHSRADVGKKKKKIAKVPRGFEFNETLDDHWKEVEHYLMEDSTNSGQKSDTVGNPEFKAFTHSSSFVGNVLWDRESREMDILLNGNKYHFCRVSERLFDSFEGAGSKGAFFNREIKTLHDC